MVSVAFMSLIVAERLPIRRSTSREIPRPMLVDLRHRFAWERRADLGCPPRVVLIDAIRVRREEKTRHHCQPVSAARQPFINSATADPQPYSKVHLSEPKIPC